MFAQPGKNDFAESQLVTDPAVSRRTWFKLRFLAAAALFGLVAWGGWHLLHAEPKFDGRSLTEWEEELAKSDRDSAYRPLVEGGGEALDVLIGLLDSERCSESAGDALAAMVVVNEELRPRLREMRSDLEQRSRQNPGVAVTCLVLDLPPNLSAEEASYYFSVRGYLGPTRNKIDKVLDARIESLQASSFRGGGSSRGAPALELMRLVDSADFKGRFSGTVPRSCAGVHERVLDLHSSIQGLCGSSNMATRPELERLFADLGRLNALVSAALETFRPGSSADDAAVKYLLSYVDHCDYCFLLATMTRANITRMQSRLSGKTLSQFVEAQTKLAEQLHLKYLAEAGLFVPPGLKELGDGAVNLRKMHVAALQALSNGPDVGWAALQRIAQEALQLQRRALTCWTSRLSGTPAEPQTSLLDADSQVTSFAGHSADEWKNLIEGPNCEAALGRLGAGGARALPVIIELLRIAAPRLRSVLVFAVGRIGRDAAPAVPVLRDLFHESDGSLRADIMHALEGIGPEAEGVVDLAIMGLGPQDDESLANFYAIKALSSFGAAAAPATADLVRILRNKPGVGVLDQAAAAALLKKLGPLARSGVPGLIEALSDDSPRTRMLAAVVLGTIGASASPALPALRKARDGSDQGVSSAARQALRQIEESR